MYGFAKEIIWSGRGEGKGGCRTVDCAASSVDVDARWVGYVVRAGWRQGCRETVGQRLGQRDMSMGGGVMTLKCDNQTFAAELKEPDQVAQPGAIKRPNRRTDPAPCTPPPAAAAPRGFKFDGGGFITSLCPAFIYDSRFLRLVTMGRRGTLNAGSVTLTFTSRSEPRHPSRQSRCHFLHFTTYSPRRHLRRHDNRPPHTHPVPNARTHRCGRCRW